MMGGGSSRSIATKSRMIQVWSLRGTCMLRIMTQADHANTGLSLGAASLSNRRVVAANETTAAVNEHCCFFVYFMTTRATTHQATSDSTMSARRRRAF